MSVNPSQSQRVDDAYLGTAVLKLSVTEFFLLLTKHGAKPVLYKAGGMRRDSGMSTFTEGLLEAGATALAVCLPDQCKSPGDMVAPHGVAVSWQSPDECLAMLNDGHSYEMFSTEEHDVASMNAIADRLEAEGAVVFMIFLLPEGVECKEEIKRFLRKGRPVLKVVTTAEA